MSNRLQHHFFFILFILAAILMYFILRPFIAALFLALALSVVFQPLYKKFLRSMRPTFSALLTVLIIIIVILIPLIFVGGVLFNESQSVYTSLSENGGIGAVTTKVAQNVETFLKGIAPDINFSVNDYIGTFFGWTVGHFDSFFSGFVQVVIGLIIMLFAIFFMLRDGGTLKRNYIRLSPLSDIDDELILDSVTRAINSVVRGSILIAIIQGILAGIGFLIAGIPNAVLWSTITAIVSLVPGVGTAITVIPAVIYLFYTEAIGSAIFLLVWGFVAVGLVDNIVGPYLIKRGLNIHHFLILLSALGGLAFFGPIGFLAGPIVLSVFFELIALYPKVVNNKE